MKIISYSLFGDTRRFEFGYYLRGIYFNVRMARLLMPGFCPWIYVSSGILHKFYAFWTALGQINPNITVFEEDNNPQRCLGMLWRMKPLFDEKVELVLCRDADSVITYREAQCNFEWLQSGMAFHAINDNDAHGGLMGGLVGFRAKEFRDKTRYKSFNDMVKGLDLSDHGSDQNFLNKTIHPKIKNDLFFHKLRGAGATAKRMEVYLLRAPKLNPKLWTADLISRYIGSAGVIDFELVRFFNDHDKNQAFDDFEKQFPQIFYWQWTL